jgi:hypothetical protein
MVGTIPHLPRSAVAFAAEPVPLELPLLLSLLSLPHDANAALAAIAAMSKANLAVHLRWPNIFLLL